MKAHSERARPRSLVGNAAWLNGVLCGLVLAAGCSRTPVSTHISQGQDALRTGEYAVAAKHLRAAVRARPESMVLHYNLGMAELNSGRLKRAAKAFERATELSHENATEAWEGLGRVRQLQGRWDAAAAAYEQAIMRAGRHPRMLAAMAAIEQREGRSEMALTLLSEALTLDPSEPTALYNMACLQRDAFQDSGAAVAYFERFLRVAPDHEGAARRTALTALEALEGIRAAPSARAEELIVRSRQATAASEALDFADAAAREDPLSPDALWNLATLSSRFGDAQRASSAYARFARRFPDDARVGRIPADIRASAGDRNMEAARRALAAGRWSAAITDWRRVLDADARNIEAWLGLSDAYRGLDDSAAALRAAEQALALKPDHPETLYRLGFLHHQRGNTQAAIEQYRRYLRVAPTGVHKSAVEDWLRSVQR